MKTSEEIEILPSGTKCWRLNGKFHRVDGPAIEWASGDKSWWLNGEPHREDGPAIEYVDGDNSWYLNGEEYSEQDWREEIFKINLKKILE